MTPKRVSGSLSFLGLVDLEGSISPTGVSGSVGASAPGGAAADASGSVEAFNSGASTVGASGSVSASVPGVPALGASVPVISTFNTSKDVRTNANALKESNSTGILGGESENGESKSSGISDVARIGSVSGLILLVLMVSTAHIGW